MKRRLLASLLSLCLLVGLLPTAAMAAEDSSSGQGTKENPWSVSAEDGSSNVIAYLTNNETMEATYGDVISLSASPSTAYTLHIEGTGAIKSFESGKQPWKDYNTQISRIVIENGITSLGDWNFQGSDATAISIPASVTEISQYAMDAMSELKEIQIDSENPSYKLSTDGVLFSADDKTLMKFPAKSDLTEYTVPITVETLNAQAFSYTELESLTLPEALKNIGDYCFAYAQNLKQLTIPDSVTEMGTYTIAYSSIEKVVLGDGITKVPDAFAYGDFPTGSDNTALKEVTFGDNVKTIGQSAFYHASGLTSVEFPDSLETIEKFAFRGCSALEGVVFPSKIETIGDSAFQDTALTKVEIGEISTLGGNVFSNCMSLEEIHIEGSENLIVPNLFGTNGSTPNTSLKRFTLETAGKMNGTLYNCNSLEVAVIGEGVKNIGINTFVNTTLETLIIDGKPTMDDYSIGGSVSGKNAGTVYCSDETFFDEVKNNGKKVPPTQMAVAYLDGGTFSDGATFSAGVLAEPVREGYTFDGWYTDSEPSEKAEDNKIVFDKYGSIANDYVAKWVKEASNNNSVAIENETGDESGSGGPVGPSNTEDPGVTTEPSTTEDIIPSEPATGDSVSQGIEPPATPEQFTTPVTKEPVVEVPPTMETAPVASSAVLGCASAVAMSFTYMAPGDGSGGDDETVYSFYVGGELLGTTEVGKTTLTYDTAQKYLKIGENTVEVYTSETKAGEPTATITINLKQKPVTVTGLTAEDRYYNGSTDITLTGGKLTGIEGTDNVTFTATGTVADASAGTNKPVTVAVVLSGTDAEWYTATASGVTVDIYETSSGGGGGGGGGSGSPSHAITVDSGKHGDVTVNRSRAAKGSTVTITVDPDAGYELDTLVVTDKNGNEIKLTDKGSGKYTFKMPGSKVTVEATFAEIVEEPEALPFVDVPTGAYYYDAVAWAVENGVTNGTSATTFGPDITCTRAQMVTFLWRAAGSPKPENTVNPFTDVSASAYYYDAVLWAVGEGITKGTSATTFSPDVTVTRGQTVTFLWRYDGSPAVSGGSFADVPADAYYASAVAWAVSEGVTNGTGATTFSPDADCTRAQIVTFLYRYMA